MTTKSKELKTGLAGHAVMKKTFKNLDFSLLRYVAIAFSENKKPKITKFLDVENELVFSLMATSTPLLGQTIHSFFL